MKKLVKFQTLLLLFYLCTVAALHAGNPVIVVIPSSDNPAEVCEGPQPNPIYPILVTPTAITIGWAPGVGAGLTYKVETQDLMFGPPVPTVYTTATSHAFTGLVPGHAYTFKVSSSYCGVSGPFGIDRASDPIGGETIVPELVVEFSNTCTPSQTISLTNPFTTCIQETYNQQTPHLFDYGFIGEVTYLGTPFTFGIGKANGIIEAGGLGQISQTLKFYRGTDDSYVKLATRSDEDNVLLLFAYTQIIPTPSLVTISKPNANVTLTLKGCDSYGNSCGSGEGGGRSESIATEATTTGIRPNPFSDQFHLSYSLPVPQQVNIRLYDVAGRLVREVFHSQQEAGAYDMNIDGADLPTGMYFLHLQTGAERSVMPVVKQAP